MRSGVRVGIDIGTVRIGVARSDRDGYLATPVETVERGSENPIGQLVSLIDEL
ncbi:MAG: Holliday junction resolvase RuvX, partial [Aurantimicrobium sp.]